MPHHEFVAGSGAIAAVPRLLSPCLKTDRIIHDHSAQTLSVQPADDLHCHDRAGRGLLRPVRRTAMGDPADCFVLAMLTPAGLHGGGRLWSRVLANLLHWRRCFRPPRCFCCFCLYALRYGLRRPLWFIDVLVSSGQSRGPLVRGDSSAEPLLPRSWCPGCLPWASAGWSSGRSGRSRNRPHRPPEPCPGNGREGAGGPPAGTVKTCARAAPRTQSGGFLSPFPRPRPCPFKLAFPGGGLRGYNRGR